MISTHILDTSKGSPAVNVGVRLQIKTGDTWKELETGTTNADGRHQFVSQVASGAYQIVFEIEDYFKKASIDYFFLDASVTFKIENNQRKYHVPLLLNPFGYSTYRGS